MQLASNALPRKMHRISMMAMIAKVVSFTTGFVMPLRVCKKLIRIYFIFIVFVLLTGPEPSTLLFLFDATIVHSHITIDGIFDPHGILGVIEVIGLAEFDPVTCI